MSTYVRYHISSEYAPNVVPHPNRFHVRVSKLGLLKLLIKELFQYRGNLQVVTSRPCIYGVFDGPIGGFWPRERLCVGCLRCTVQYPDIVTVEPNTQRTQLGDSYFTPDKVDTVIYEATTGHIPVRGAGYGGVFGGEGWDGMWTDMSEIVRPTRDGIHGREFISTIVDLGQRPDFLQLNDLDEPDGSAINLISLPVPFLIDRPPRSAESEALYRALSSAAAEIGTIVFIPLKWVLKLGLAGKHVVPVVKPSEVMQLDDLSDTPKIIELDGWDEGAYKLLHRRLPDGIICLRIPCQSDLLPYIEAGVGVFHLTSDYHGKTGNNFVLEAIRGAHEMLLTNGVREQVTFIGSGGIILAEHVPKAIICGLDAVALDTSLLSALQARFIGDCIDYKTAKLELPPLDIDWAHQRIVNLIASWRGQMLEVLGAMGLREVRRLRGELGRAMFQVDLEREAFAEISGYKG